MSHPIDPGFRKISQIAIVCRDIETSAERWSRILGMDQPKTIVVEPGSKRKMTYRTKPSNAQCKLAFFHLDNIDIELIEPMGGDSAWQEGLDKNGESVHHLGIWVNDMDESLNNLSENGIPTIQKAFMDDHGSSYAYVDSTSQLGVMLELLHKKEPKKK